MLTRRTFLTTIAATPLAKFCKTEPVRPYAIDGVRGMIWLDEPLSPDIWKVMDKLMEIHGQRVRFVDYLYALPQGTLA